MCYVIVVSIITVLNITDVIFITYGIVVIMFHIIFLTYTGLHLGIGRFPRKGNQKTINSN